jgi:hypothetical protein
MKDNNIIAYFMGGEIIKEEHYEMPHGSYHDVVINDWKIPLGIPSDSISSAKIGLFNYHNDWNSLIPVIEKIENLVVEDEVFRIISHKNRCIVEAQLTCFHPSEFWHIHLQTEGKNKIDATYLAIVTFINWLNKLKIKQ